MWIVPCDTKFSGRKTPVKRTTIYVFAWRAGEGPRWLGKVDNSFERED